ncbi:MAG: EF-Tu/IF-2/RF-3 family GTPase, partial [archaeon]|nr:EF-Tu/IF-2/RF-3 family GTPase [archaeon]
EIQKFLADYGYQNSPIIPISANQGVNIDILIEAIEKHIPTPKGNESRDLRMFAVRSFDVNKPGTKPKDLKGGVIGGSIISGKICVGDEIEISPGIEGKPMTTTVTSLGVEGGMIDEAKAGGLIAVGTKIDPFYMKNDELRGQIIARPGSLPRPQMELVLEVTALERLLDKGNADLKAGDYAVLAVGTSTVIGQVTGTSGKNTVSFRLRNAAVIEKGQKVAISKREQSGWRLRAYGEYKG